VCVEPFCRLPDWLIFAESAGYAAVYQDTKGKQVGLRDGGGGLCFASRLYSSVPGQTSNAGGPIQWGRWGGVGFTQRSCHMHSAALTQRGLVFITLNHDTMQLSTCLPCTVTQKVPAV
jgi:hypothetical protein